MTISDPAAQIEFLRNVQALLHEGAFSSTYKYALFHALLDLSVRRGDGTDAELELSLREVGDQFIVRYWDQVAPFPGLQLRAGDHRHTLINGVLLQNAGAHTAVVARLSEARQAYTTLHELRADGPAWRMLLGAVVAQIRKMPLRKLQTFGGETHEFLYRCVPRSPTITLLPGVANHLTTFYDLLTSLVQGHWLQAVRRLNRGRLAETADLGTFLFGRQRQSPSAVVPLLREVQDGKCFYCGRAPGSAVVDHFIPWSRYSIDLGHNFVLADATCNTAKSAWLAAECYLEAWCERNARHAKTLRAGFDSIPMSHDLQGSERVARWAYNAVAARGGTVWAGPRTTRRVRLSHAWRDLLPTGSGR